MLQASVRGEWCGTTGDDGGDPGNDVLLVSWRRPFEVLLVALRLGLTSFGGPVAHLGYFRSEYVERRRWLDDAEFGDLVALCQFLPGPASSQLGIAIGWLRAGLLGGFLAWLGFTLPSALALALFAAGVGALDLGGAGWLAGLEVAAVAVVANALWGMARTLSPDRARITLAIAAAVVVLVERSALSQLLVIAAGGLIGWRLLANVSVPDSGRGDAGQRAGWRFGTPLAVAALTLFVALLVALPAARQLTDWQPLALVDSFYRTGSLVFGGGHVVLPLIESEVVGTGWVSTDQFLAGYGAAQAVPGPLFAFSAYLGWIASPAPGGWAGAGLALGAIYLPSFLLLAAALPFWERLRRRAAVQAALRGIGASVVGLLLAALYDPVWSNAIGGPADFGLALGCFGLLFAWRAPAWSVVLVAAAGGEVLSRLA